MESIRSSSHIEECPIYRKDQATLMHTKELNIDGMKFVFCANCVAYHTIQPKDQGEEQANPQLSTPPRKLHNSSRKKLTLVSNQKILSRVDLAMSFKDLDQQKSAHHKEVELPEENQASSGLAREKISHSAAKIRAIGASGRNPRIGESSDAAEPQQLARPTIRLQPRRRTKTLNFPDTSLNPELQQSKMAEQSQNAPANSVNPE